MKRLIHELRNRGHQVFCALEYTNWNLSELAVPEDELRTDLAEIDACDKLLILLEERVSAGVQLENGYAYAKGKRFEIYQIGKSAWSNVAFARLAASDTILVQSVTDFVEQALRNNP